MLEALPCRPGGPERSDLFPNLEPGPDLGLEFVDPCRIGLATGDLDQAGQERDDVQVGQGLQRNDPSVQGAKRYLIAKRFTM